MDRRTDNVVDMQRSNERFFSRDSRLGERRYRILTNNCEHFCEWCLNGASRSHRTTCSDAYAKRWRNRRPGLYQSLKRRPPAAASKTLLTTTVYLGAMSGRQARA
jgi:hypothetical protein